MSFPVANTRSIQVFDCSIVRLSQLKWFSNHIVSFYFSFQEFLITIKVFKCSIVEMLLKSVCSLQVHSAGDDVAKKLRFAIRARSSPARMVMRAGPATENQVRYVTDALPEQIHD